MKTISKIFSCLFIVLVFGSFLLVPNKEILAAVNCSSEGYTAKYFETSSPKYVKLSSPNANESPDKLTLYDDGTMFTSKDTTGYTVNTSGILYKKNNGKLSEFCSFGATLFSSGSGTGINNSTQKVTGRLTNAESGDPIPGIYPVAHPIANTIETCESLANKNPINGSLSNNNGYYSILLEPNKLYKLCIYKKIDDWKIELGEQTLAAIPGLGTFLAALEKDTYWVGEITIEIDDRGAPKSGGSLDIVLSTVTENVFTKTVAQAMGTVVNLLKGAIKLASDGVGGVLEWGNKVTEGDAIKQVWTAVRNLALLLITLALLIIAFANVLSIDLERYGINRMIPRLILSIVMAYFSFLITRFLLELASAFQAQLAITNINGGSDAVKSIGAKYALTSIQDNVSAMNIGHQISASGMLLFSIIILLLLLVAFIWLWLILLVRAAFLWILIAIAPFAFLMNVMPFTEFLYKKWWETFWKWLFMGPAVMVMLWLAGAMLDSFGSFAEGWALLLFAAVSIFIAATMPLTMGGSIVKAVQSKGLKVGDWLTGKRVSGWWNTRKSMKEEQRKVRDLKTFAKMGPVAGTLLGGMNEQQRNRAELAYVQNLSKEYSETNLGLDDLNEKAKAGNQYEKKAAILTMLEQGGNLTTSDKDIMQATHEMIFEDNGEIKNQALFGKLYSEQPQALCAMATQGKNVKNWADKALRKGLADPKDAKKEHMQYMLQERRDVFDTLMKNKGAVQNILDRGGPAAHELYGDAIRKTQLKAPQDRELQLMYNKLVEASLKQQQLNPKGENTFGEEENIGYASPVVDQGEGGKQLLDKDGNPLPPSGK